MAQEQRQRFTTFLTIADSSCWRSLFRFSEDEIDLLGRLLQIPAELPTRNGYDISGKDVFCMFLRRLAYPNRLADLERLFGRSQAALSVITNAVLTHIYDRWHHLLRLDRHRLTEANCLHYPALNYCIGYIDGTRKHALKYQSVITPDGIVRHLHGPVPGTKHDAFLLATSTLSDEMRALPTSGSTRCIIYVDPAYS
ncbi:TPA: hypothetical protein N0F65_006302 [Lagenidium giganteum]|uniref:DDE Tnp4 domain-containing protein n=1 Tax=Lagenidium giganteum TaxID=4803 RepID=A0AAV2YQ91_9STRA|nr:TPA: hypothetical protein N0F65_006302 [Lagenidium giganteum]